MPNFHAHYALLLTLLTVPILLSAQLDPLTVSIPMSDGKMLAGDLYLPNETGTFPTILIQTPYNKNSFTLSGLPLGVGYDIESSDFAFLIVDWRCYFASLAACGGAATSGEDGYDTVEWIAQQSWSDGQVGTWGPSALGTVQFQTAREQPPHLVCAVPIVVSPQTSHQKFYPGGALRVDYSSFVGTYFGFQGLITYNPYYNLLWTITENNTMYPADIDIPMLIIGGWYDHNTDDCLIMFDTLRSSSTPAVREQHRILMGPWSHSRVGNAQQGELSYPNSEGYDDLRAKAFFDYHLRNVNNGWENTPFVEYYQMGENTWAGSAQWPPQDLSVHPFYLREDFSLQTDAPAFAAQSFSFSYDPTDPSPSIGGKLFNANLFDDNVGPLDQSAEVESRNDNLIFTSEILSEPLKLQGEVAVELFLSSDRIDTDLAIRLTDVYPDGRSIILGEALQRLHFRNGNSIQDTAYMEPGEVYPIRLKTEQLAHTFLPGHQLRLIITSSNYPRYNRNMNTGGPMHPNGNIDTLVNPLVATNTLHIGLDYPAVVELPIDASSLGASRPLEGGQVRAFPNPSGGVVQLEDLPEWKALEIYGLHGRLLWRHAEPGAGGSLAVDLRQLDSGQYLLKVIQQNGQVTGTALTIQH